jgi:hypothetical protein
MEALVIIVGGLIGILVCHAIVVLIDKRHPL